MMCIWKNFFHVHLCADLREAGKGGGGGVRGKGLIGNVFKLRILKKKTVPDLINGRRIPKRTHQHTDATEACVRYCVYRQV
jgi:hypothetical protein